MRKLVACLKASKLYRFLVDEDEYQPTREELRELRYGKADKGSNDMLSRDLEKNKGMEE
ncbi:hypothetical protein D3C72_1757550 [compost metagenome]